MHDYTQCAHLRFKNENVPDERKDKNNESEHVGPCLQSFKSNIIAPWNRNSENGEAYQIFLTVYW